MRRKFKRKKGRKIKEKAGYEENLKERKEKSREKAGCEENAKKRESIYIFWFTDKNILINRHVKVDEK